MFFFYRYRASLLALFMLVLGACEHVSNRPDPGPLPGFQDWKADGKASLRVDETRSADGKASSQTFRFKWLQEGADFDISLSGTFGFGSTRIVGNESRVNVSRGNEIIAESDNPDSLLMQTTGLELPIRYLRYWALGLSATPLKATGEAGKPELHRCASTDSCALAPLSELGWEIEFLSVENIQGSALPRKIVASTEGLKLTIIIGQWSSARAFEL